MLNFAGHKSQHITYVDGLLLEQDCNDLVNQCLKNYDKLFTHGPTMGGYDPTMKSSMDFNFSVDNCVALGVEPFVFSECYAKVQNALQSAMALYLESYTDLHHSTGLYDSGFRLQHYAKNSGFYRRHHDGAPWDKEPVNRRVLAVIVYLNTVSKGGGTIFSEHGITVDAVAGRIAIFPATWTHPHSGLVPISNDKWIISTFIHCENPLKNEQTNGTEIKPREVSEEELNGILNV